jgi:hypothetical protein
MDFCDEKDFSNSVKAACMINQDIDTFKTSKTGKNDRYALPLLTLPAPQLLSYGLS